MPFDPKKSREAHSEIGIADCVAASSLPPVSSPQECGPRDPHPAAGRGATTGQPFLIGRNDGRAPKLRHVKPIPPHILRQIFDEDRAFNRRRIANDDAPPSWSQIAIAALAAFAFVVFIILLDGGALS